MTFVEEMKERILAGETITGKEALRLYDEPFNELSRAADEIRRYFCGEKFDLCTIINGKSGRCPENCKFCAQSAHYETGVKTYPLLDVQEMVAAAEREADSGALRFSIVTSGKTLTEAELDVVCEAIRAIRAKVHIAVCVSLGLLTEAQFRRVKAAGANRAHDNLETSERYFPNVCTTHAFEEKITAIRAAQKAGLTVCSGGIMGLGETKEDRVDMALTLRSLGIKSVPVNLLNPIPGTPFEENSPLTDTDMARIVAVYRFLLPDASIRLAGGRGLLADKGKACFQSGANAAISGDMLTTAGYSVETDLALIKELGFVPALCG